MGQYERNIDAIPCTETILFMEAGFRQIPAKRTALFMESWGWHILR